MTREVRLREEADEDLNEAAAWYEAQRSGLGAEFLDSVLAGFRSIAATPLRYALIRGRIRRAMSAPIFERLRVWHDARRLIDVARISARSRATQTLPIAERD